MTGVWGAGLAKGRPETAGVLGGCAVGTAGLDGGAKRLREPGGGVAPKRFCSVADRMGGAAFAGETVGGVKRLLADGNGRLATGAEAPALLAEDKDDTGAKRLSALVVGDAPKSPNRFRDVLLTVSPNFESDAARELPNAFSVCKLESLGNRANVWFSDPTPANKLGCSFKEGLREAVSVP